MSIILAAAAVLISVASGAPQPGPLPNWRVATAAPESAPQPMNTVRLEGNRLLWNGVEVSEATVRQYLGIVNQMSPRPLTVLSYSAQTSVARVQRARLLIEDVIRCIPRECMEITIPPGRTG